MYRVVRTPLTAAPNRKVALARLGQLRGRVACDRAGREIDGRGSDRGTATAKRPRHTHVQIAEFDVASKTINGYPFK